MYIIYKIWSILIKNSNLKLKNLKKYKITNIHEKFIIIYKISVKINNMKNKFNNKIKKQ